MAASYGAERNALVKDAEGACPSAVVCAGNAREEPASKMYMNKGTYGKQTNSEEVEETAAMQELLMAPLAEHVAETLAEELTDSNAIENEGVYPLCISGLQEEVNVRGYSIAASNEPPKATSTFTHALRRRTYPSETSRACVS